MDNWIMEYQQWYDENFDFINELHHHESLIYDRLYPVQAVIETLVNRVKNNDITVDADIEKIASVGLEFLFDQLETCKLYLDTTFHGDVHEFLQFDSLINAMLYIDDLKYELEEKKISYNRDRLEALQDELETMMASKQPVDSDFTLYLDDQVKQVYTNESFELYGIVDIFVDIADTLGLDLYDVDEILIGKDF